MSQYSIEIRFDECISCGVCYALDPLHFESDVDGRAHVKNGQNDSGVSRGDFDDAGIGKPFEIESACPTSIITIKHVRM